MKHVLLSLFACSLLLLTGCEETTSKDNAYSFGISSYNGSLGDLAAIEGYLKGKGAPLSPQIFTGKDDADTDKQAKAAFDKAAAKLSRDEIKELGLSSSASFTYSAARSDDKGETVTVARFTYP
ncbi:hypothetical protein [Limibacterium fermenti]|uniref:hypothetical protein n=1 Tax=Limibacterium fermenti TaxID=3229863 RepID=UPI00267AA141